MHILSWSLLHLYTQETPAPFVSIGKLSSTLPPLLGVGVGGKDLFLFLPMTWPWVVGTTNTYAKFVYIGSALFFSYDFQMYTYTYIHTVRVQAD